jgi:hypothetical protein
VKALETDLLALEAGLVSGLRALGRELHAEACTIEMLDTTRVEEILACFGLCRRDVDRAAGANPGWVEGELRLGWILAASDAMDDIGDEDRCRYHDVLLADAEAWGRTEERL